MPGIQITELPIPVQNIVKRVPILELPVRFGWSFALRWDSDRCPLMAAAMAFFGLLSIFPLMLAAVAILSRGVSGSKGVLEGFRVFVSGFFPGAAQQIIHEIDAIAAGPDATALGIVAIGSLIWSGRAYFDTLASVLNTIWPNTKPRTFWSHQLALWSLFLGAGLLWLLSTAATVAFSTVRVLSARLPDLFLNRTPGIWQFMTHMLSWLLTFCMFLLLYRFLPNVETRRRRRVVLVAAVLGSLLWEVAKWLFTNVISHNLTRYQSTYGSVAGVVLTMLWIYFSSLILLIGAELAAVYEELCPPNEDCIKT